MEEAVPQDLGQRAERVEVAVVACGLAADIHVDGMVEVIAPLPFEAIPVDAARVEQARVVQVRLGDHGYRTPCLGGHGVAQRPELLQQVNGPLVLKGVHGIERRPSTW
ncbi:hypothetical protein AHiyo6_27630 [Arthrobacter sp. Hiyo6]|nr:hypothetical protein AHiyo6_27630 [Arthrobacter sp. Hiyo6]